MQKGQRSVEDGLFGARRWKNLGVRVERDAVAALHPASECFPETSFSRRARVLADLGDAIHEGAADGGVCRLAGIPCPEVEEFDAALLKLPAAFVQPEQRVCALSFEHRVQ
jgi:hypothetical protein